MQKKLTSMDKTILSDFDNIYNELGQISYFNDKVVFITGATGFLGGYLTKYFIYLNKYKNANIKILCLYRNKDRLLQKFSGEEISEIVPIDQEDQIILAQFSINYVFYAASLASPKYFKDHPIEVIEPNVIGLINILNLLDKSQLIKFIYFSTTGVAGFVDDQLRPNPEDIYGPLDCCDVSNCYLESKRMGEMICAAWISQRGYPISIVRPAITYGPGIELDDGRSYADFISNIVKNNDILIYSDGSAVRNFLYVSDLVTGLILIATKGVVGSAYNLASESEVSIKNLAIKLADHVFKSKNIKVIFARDTKNFTRINFTRTTVSVSKIKNLGWRETVKLEEGFKRTVNYYEILNHKKKI